MQSIYIPSYIYIRAVMLLQKKVSTKKSPLLSSSHNLKATFSPLAQRASSRESLTRPDSWAWDGVGGRNGPVELEEDTWVLGVVSTWDSDLGAWVAAATAGDVDLSAGEVELGTSDLSGAVQADVLDAEKVLAAGGVFGDGGAERELACMGVRNGIRKSRGQRWGTVLDGNEKNVPSLSQVIFPPEKVAPCSKILNQTAPLPSKVLAV